MSDGQPITLTCADGIALRGHLWPSVGVERGTAIINPATGVLARYYHRYARFLAGSGYTVVTYDYRGIGLSRPARLRDCGIRWRDWGERDFEAVLAFARARDASAPIVVVGHSIGGFLIGFAASAPTIERILTVGAQYAYWRDYAAEHRRKLFWRWHVVMPALTAACGYFPGRRLGWLEDLPAGVANEWSFRRARMEASYPADQRAVILARFAAVKAPILALAMSDDEYATEPAMSRALAHYTGSERRMARLDPAVFDQQAIGHFAPFHDRYRDTFWPMTLDWLQNGIAPASPIDPAGPRVPAEEPARSPGKPVSCDLVALPPQLRVKLASRRRARSEVAFQP